MEIGFIVLSILVGLIPESAFMALVIVFSKNTREKRIALFSLILLSNIICGMLLMGSLWYHFAFMSSIYLILFILYRSHIMDVFLITTTWLYIAIIGAFCFFVFDNYIIGLIINRLLLLVPLLLFTNKFNAWYKIYVSLWDRKEGNPIKSITLRNWSLVILNILMLILNMAAISINTWLGG